MTLLLRKLQLLLRAPFQKPLKSPTEESSIFFRVLPIDIDEFWHMNNAKYANYMEVSRYDLVIRAGYLKLYFLDGIIAPLASLRMVFVKQLKMFQRFEIRSRVLGWDKKWAIIGTRFLVEGEIVAYGLIRFVGKRRGKTIPPKELFSKLGYDTEEELSPGRVELWKSSDAEILAAFEKTAEPS